ncbi:hypothetical protein [Marinobacter adhaerens]|uniref:hypothetical protein n=1 Tax=Marinobacter adhaerens TaxID=1033846 RepID=UPI003D09D6F1
MSQLDAATCLDLPLLLKFVSRKKNARGNAKQQKAVKTALLKGSFGNIKFGGDSCPPTTFELDLY